MPTPKKGPRLGGSAAHQRKILSNLATQLIENGSITTTEAKAKLLQPYFEKLVTKAKSGTIHDRRIVARKIRSKDAIYQLFDEIVPEIDSERNGGYTRVTRIGNRKGDNAPMAVIEIITEPVMKKATVKAAEAPAKKAAKKSAKKVEEAPVQAEETVTEDLESAAGSEEVAEEAAEAVVEEGDASAVEEEVAEDEAK
ncbi:50S ribosomal protein L17 [Actinomycetaceae bacterium MB13-C1-2]|nr:50S ribosomal protein L17 [Actinomycetaceae bacterium MB13-C1-2]